VELRFFCQFIVFNKCKREEIDLPRTIHNTIQLPEIAMTNIAPNKRDQKILSCHDSS